MEIHLPTGIRIPKPEYTEEIFTCFGFGCFGGLHGLAFRPTTHPTSPAYPPPRPPRRPGTRVSTATSIRSVSASVISAPLSPSRQ